MATRIRGTATVNVDFIEDEDLSDLEAEEAFNQAILDIYNNDWEYGNADYDQDHEFNVEEDDNERW